MPGEKSTLSLVHPIDPNERKDRNIVRSSSLHFGRIAAEAGEGCPAAGVAGRERQARRRAGTRFEKKIARQEEEEKNRRLLARGALLEGLIENAPQLTDGQVEEILTIALRQDAVKKAIARMKPVAPAEPAPILTGKEEKPNE